MKIIPLFFLFITTITTCFSQEIINKEYQTKFTFLPNGETRRINFTCLIPNDIAETQKVKSITFSKAPEREFVENEKKYVTFRFDNIREQQELTINVVIDIYRKDFSIIKDTTSVPESFDNFLIEENYIEKNNPKIVEKAIKLSKNNTLKTVKNIYQFVYQNIQYNGFNTQDLGALKALESGKGDCTEFSDLFVSLCRANNIPAKVIEGYMTEYNETPLHSWVEVYIEKNGWVRIDPTPNNAISFSKLKNMYIQLSNIRNDEILKKYHRWTYTYFGDPVKVTEELKFFN